MKAMKERPILFSRPMVKAILAGRKTQTRRIIKPQPSSGMTPWVEDETGILHCRSSSGLDHHGWDFLWCPYGKGGDRLWVREEHFRFGHWSMVPGIRTKGGRQKWKFVADDSRVLFPGEPDAPKEFRKGRHHKAPATPAWHRRLARFMPRIFCRITLEVVAVRVERLQDISETDAKAEGLHQDEYGLWTWGDYPSGSSNPCYAYRLLWESINGAGSWDENPWVWVVEFKR